MNKITSLIVLTTLCATATAQLPGYMTTFAQPENSTSGSGGTVLGQLLPNEITLLEFNSACLRSAEKWLPRTATHTMAGDENADGMHFNPGILGSIDALLTVATYGPPPLQTQRTVYYSPEVAMGTNISGSPGLRPGDIGRINRVGGVDGQIEYFITQELINNALGLPAAYPINIDAACFQPNFGLFFSVDDDVPGMTICGPALIRDGDVLCLPGGTMGYTGAMTVAATTPNSAVRVYTENQMSVMTANAMVADRFGGCVTSVIDIESLEMDLAGPTTTFTPCPGYTIPVPTLVYSCEAGTGASLLETSAGGSIHNTVCGPAGESCTTGNPTMGPQMGIRPASLTVGAPSWINALCTGRGCRHVLEPQAPVVSGPAPPGATMIDSHTPFALGLILVELVSPVVPSSVPAFPFSPTCFPDLYAPSIFPWVVVSSGYDSFPMVGIPAAFTGKVLFQNVGFGAGVFELSTPAVIDII